MQSKISPVEAIVNAAILDSALERFFSVGEGIPKRHRLGYQKTKTPLHEPYMGTYVSGTPVRGGGRTIYLQRLRWLHSEAQGHRLARTRRCLLLLTEHKLLHGLINTQNFFFWPLRYRCWTSPLWNCKLVSFPAQNWIAILMQLFWKDPKGILTEPSSKSCYGDVPFLPGASAFSASIGSAGEMFQGFPGDPDSGSRGSSSPSAESQYLSSVDSFGSPSTSTAPQECVSTAGGGGVGSAGSAPGVDMPGSFIPTVTAITTSQDLQWMVQPTLISSVAPGQSGTGTTTMTQSVSLDPYDMPGPSFSSGSGFTPPSSDTPGPLRQSRSRRRTREESLTPEEEEKMRVRRERNKLAAAKCRNRRRELTDRLQSETDLLEEEKAELEAEISELQKEKERLEFVLITHQPSCKIPPYQEEQQQTPAPPQPPSSSVSVVGLTVKDSSFYLPPPYSSHHHHLHQQQQQHHQQQQQQPTQQQGMMQEVAFSSSFYGPSQPAPGGLCLVADGGGTPDAGSHNPSYTSSFVFTYPEGACGTSANQRTSSSEQSSDSMNSPSLLAL